MAILIPIIVLGGLGLIFAIGLSYASKKFAFEVDPKVEAVENALAGLNCGVCGFPGCKGYAEAIVAGKVEINKCAPGGAESVKKIAAIMGIEAQEIVPKMAVASCKGGKNEAKTFFNYQGIEDCKAAQMVVGGFKACSYGCLGLGSCAKACPFDAITMSENGLPVVDPKKCTACGICVNICPRGIMTLIPRTQKVYLACNNKNAGPKVRGICEVGCISCRLCTKRNPLGEDGIKIDGKLPAINYEKLTSWQEANEICPRKCYIIPILVRNDTNENRP